MSLSFPRDMISQARWETPRLFLVHMQELGRRWNGIQQARDLGTPYWKAEFESVPLRLEAAHALMADFNTLGGARRTFYLYDPVRAKPASLAVAEGSALESAVVRVASVGASNDTLALKDLPAGFEMSRGDLLSVTPSNGGRELFELAEAGTASAGGLTPAMTVRPFVPGTVQVDDVVTLIKPLVEMRLEPESLIDRWRGKRHKSIVFRAVQEVTP